MPQQPQPLTFSDEDIKQLASDPMFSDDDFRKLSEADKSRYLNARPTSGSKFGQMPSPMAPPPSQGEPLNLFGSVAKMPGTWESLLSMPAGLAGVYPPLKPLTTPVAAGLGGIGSVIDDMLAGKGFDVGSFIGGAGRQGVTQGIGDLLAGPAAHVTMGAALPGAEKRAISAALDTGAGTNIGKAFDAAKSAGNDIAERVASFGPGRFMRDQLTKGADDVIDHTVGQSMKEGTTRQTMDQELKDILLGGPSTLTPEQILEKKRGARVGYEALTQKQVRNAPIAPPSLLQGVVGDNAQKLLEGLDQSVYKPNAFEESLADINRRSGAIQSLIQHLSARGDRSAMDGLLPRFFLGTLLGALPEYATGGGMERYGPAGLAGGMALGLAPAGTAKALQAAGTALPPLVRGTTAILGMQRRKPQDPTQ